MNVLFIEKFRKLSELEAIENAAKTLRLKYEIDWDTRECSLDDPLYEITVFDKERE